jgi:hypothetical protein
VGVDPSYPENAKGRVEGPWLVMATSVDAEDKAVVLTGLFQ